MSVPKFMLQIIQYKLSVYYCHHSMNQLLNESNKTFM